MVIMGNMAIMVVMVSMDIAAMCHDIEHILGHRVWDLDLANCFSVSKVLPCGELRCSLC